MKSISPLHGLNQAQKEAVLYSEGPLLIVAGAGTGKTRTITHRIAHLVKSGIPPRAILGITFTNKAAGEMRNRVRHLLSEQAGGLPLLTTFHSLGVRLLREFHKEAEVPRNFSIWDRDDSMKALKRVLDKLGLGELSPKSALMAISREKGKGVGLREYGEKAHSYRERALARVWESYEDVLSKEEALDFDDLLGRTLSLFLRSKEIRLRLQERYTHITIDEYQDTNMVQMEIARLLAGEKKNICAVGDIDQNIYSWRGADIGHLLSFEKTFPGTRTVVLEQNYRSTRTILAAANSVIEKNLRRKPKHLSTENVTGEPIGFWAARNETDEAWFVVQSVQQLVESGTRPRAIAILYRENFQSRVLEEAFLQTGIPYRVLGVRFFERKEVKDALSYVRSALNPKSGNDLRRIVGTPPRGIGKMTLEKMLAPLENRPVPGAAAAWGGFSLTGLAGTVRTKVEKFISTLEGISKAIQILPASEAVRLVLEESGLEKMFREGGPEEHERLENVHELVNLTTQYDDLPPPQGIERLLEEAALQSEQDELDESADAVSLMTVHASKGLEFDAVFITGLEQGLFPSAYDDTDRDPEEERRLFYVALTRARLRLFLSYARERLKYGSRQSALPSEFLGDIDQRLMSYARSVQEESEKIIE